MLGLNSRFYGRRPLLVLALGLSMLLMFHTFYEDSHTFPIPDSEATSSIPKRPTNHKPPPIPPAQAPPAKISKVGLAVSRDGILYDPFPSPTVPDLVKDTSVRPILSHVLLSDLCVEHWVTHDGWDGPCSSQHVDESVIDLVWTWVNGSDPLHQIERGVYLNETGHHAAASRFREHDELRHSLRAAQHATGKWGEGVWHIITADVGNPEDPSQRLGLLPQWLNVTDSIDVRQGGRPPIVIHHDSQLFRYSRFPKQDPLDMVEEWRKRVLPTFNSHAIEAQLPNLDPERTSENIVALNDDHYLVLEMPPSTFSSVLYGPVFRFDPSRQLSGDNAGLASGEHEALSLRWASHVLDDRFGTRKRAYVGHNARALSLPLMHEASLAFADNFMYTALSRFRGLHRKPYQYEINTIFISTHFVIERHREALLWSWIVAKWGGVDGVLTERKKDGMWAEMGGEEGNDNLWVKSAAAMSTADERIASNMKLAGLEPPGSSEPTRRANTTYVWTSHDGFPVDFDGTPLIRKITRQRCLSKGDERSWDVFRRVFKEDVKCGDAIISMLKVTSNQRGLSIFLPRPSKVILTPDDEPSILPLTMQNDPPPLPANPRSFAIRLLHRYAYAIAETPSRFFGMTIPAESERNLYLTEQQTDIAFLCINDDMPEDDKVYVKTAGIYLEYLEKKWPVPLDCEQ